MGREAGPLDYATPEVGERSVVRAVRRTIVALMMVLAVGVVGLLLVSLASDPNAYETPIRVQCESNVKQIGSAILLYSNENGGRYPDRLGELLMAEDISAEVFVCPATKAVPATGPTMRAVANGVDAGGRHLSYIYLGAGLTTACDPDTVVLYEPPADHQGEGMHVLFGDGRVEFLAPAKARDLLSRVGAGEHPVVWKRGGARAGSTTHGG